MRLMKSPLFPHLLIRNAKADHLDAIYLLREDEANGTAEQIAFAKRRAMDLEVQVRKHNHGY